MELLDYGFNTVKMKVLKTSGTIVKKIKLDKADKEVVNIALKDDLGVIEQNYKSSKKYEYKVSVKDFSLPIKKGTIVGKIDVYYKNKLLNSGKLVVKEDVKPLGYFMVLYRGIMDVVTGDL